MVALGVFIPMDRRQAMAHGQSLPDRTQGAALLADISGFTPLTEALVAQLGARRGADELARQLNRVFDVLVAQVYRYGGSVIGFSGDAVTCWFDGDEGARATACGMEMQAAMSQFHAVPTPRGDTISLAMKVAVAAGPARRFLVGNPEIRLMDVLAGATLDRMATGEQLAERGDVIVAPEVCVALGDRLVPTVQHTDPETGDRYTVVQRLSPAVQDRPWDQLAEDTLPEAEMRPWLLPAVYERLLAGRGRFLAEIRPAAALFLRFDGPNYDDDEAAGRKLDTYIRWVQQVAGRHGGYLLRLTVGDKGNYMLLTFGVPIAHDDDPLRAVAAALDLQTSPQPGPELGVQIGISNGLVWAGAYGAAGRQTYGVQGDEVNIAARLMGRAEHGQILVTSRVARAVEGLCQLAQLGSVAVKGKREPLMVSAVLGRYVATQQAAVSAFRSPLLGREPELGAMDKAASAALSGEGQVLRLEGEPGLGKSHLAAEFAERSASRGFRVAWASCQSTERAVVYSPWRHILGGLLALPADTRVDPAAASQIEEQVDALRTAVARVNPGLVPRLALLGDVMGLPVPDTATTAAFGPRVRQRALLALVVELVRTQARAQPLLLVIDDLRWMDEASEELTLAVARGIHDVPVLLVLVHRPPEREEQGPLQRLASLAHCHHLPLGELAPGAVADLATAQLGGQPSPLATALIQALAQGNPFFVEELIGALRESGRLCPGDGGVWALSEEMVRALDDAHCLSRPDRAGERRLEADAPLATANLGVPDSIHGVVLSRFDRLPEAHKLTLKVASVVGRTFEATVLAEAHPAVPEEQLLQRQIGELQRREFVWPQSRADADAYVFRHSTTHEAVYGTLPEDQRRELHAAVGQALERRLPSAIQRMAYHFYRGRAWGKALDYNLGAGDQLKREFANRLAISAYRRALEASGNLDRETRHEQLSAHESLGDVLTLVGEYEPALEHYASARELVQPVAEEPLPRRHLADLCRKTAEVCERRSEFDLAHRWLSEGMSYLEEASPTIEAARIHIVQAGVYQRQGRYDEALVHCIKSLETASAVPTREGRHAVAHAYLNLGGCSLRHGDLQKAVSYCSESAAIYGELGDLDGRSKAYNNLGLAYKAQGDWVRASEALGESLAINREIGAIQEQGFVTNNLGNIFLNRGDWARAVALFEESNQVWRQLGAAFPEAVTLSNLAQLHIYQRDWGRAHAGLSRSEGIFRQIGSEDWMPELERRWAEYWLGTGDLETALAHAEESVRLAAKQEARLEEGMTLRVLGQVRLARCDLAAAREALLASQQVLDELESEYEAAKTALSLARLALEQGARETVSAYLDRSEQTFRKLGAEADLAQAVELRALAEGTPS